GVAAPPGWQRRLIFSRRPFVDALFLLTSFPVGLVAFVSLVVMLSLGVGLAIIWIGLPILVLAILGWRQAAGLERWRIGAFLGVPIPDPHQPWPAGSVWRRLRTMLADPAVWRDLAYWILLFPIGVAELVLVVTAVTVTASLLAAPFTYRSVDINMGSVHVHTLPAALALVLLGPNRAGRLAERVDVLAESRARMVDASIDERRRIEGDLHDGGQQRLVALAMDLGMARERMESDPDSARELVDEAHEEAKRALAELRDLVRGINPAVLTDRGLDAAVSALAGRSQVPVTVSCDVPGRLPEAIESTAYFVVAEGLTNVAKHSRARHAYVNLRLSDAVLCVEI